MLSFHVLFAVSGTLSTTFIAFANAGMTDPVGVGVVLGGLGWSLVVMILIYFGLAVALPAGADFGGAARDPLAGRGKPSTARTINEA